MYKTKLYTNDMDSLPCSVNRNQTTMLTRNTNENKFKCPNRLNHSFKCSIENCNNINDMGLSGNRKRIPKYCNIFGLHYTQFCVLVLVACISFTQSAPTTHHQVRHRRENKLAARIRPCTTQNMSLNNTNDYTTEQMRKIFNIIADECVVALQNAQGHAPKFVSIRWKQKNNSDSVVESAHNTWRKEDGAWLHPQRNKQFNYNETIPSDIKSKIVRQLENLNKEDSEKLLIDMYERFMRIAYGINIIIDEHPSNTIYKDDENYELKHIYDKLKLDIDVILCEINEGILLLNLKPDVPESFEADSLNSAIVRDWVIYREYMSLLNFISVVYNNQENK